MHAPEVRPLEANGTEKRFVRDGWIEFQMVDMIHQHSIRLLVVADFRDGHVFAFLCYADLNILRLNAMAQSATANNKIISATLLP